MGTKSSYRRGPVYLEYHNTIESIQMHVSSERQHLSGLFYQNQTNQDCKKLEEKETLVISGRLNKAPNRHRLKRLFTFDCG